MMITALPAGMVLALQMYFKAQWEWQWAVTSGVLFMALTAIVGGVLYRIGGLLVRDAESDHEEGIGE
jgi:hypothetical protein